MRASTSASEEIQLIAQETKSLLNVSRSFLKPKPDRPTLLANID
jgi:hypothetical protein